MRICPKCGKVVSYNSYFGAYICSDCGWEDATCGQKRNMGINSISYRVANNKKILKNHQEMLSRKRQLQ